MGHKNDGLDMSAFVCMAKNEVCFRKRFLDQCVDGPGLYADFLDASNHIP